MHESWEGLIVQITGGGLNKTVTLGNIYRHPRGRNDDLNSFIHYIILGKQKQSFNFRWGF